MLAERLPISPVEPSFPLIRRGGNRTRRRFPPTLPRSLPAGTRSVELVADRCAPRRAAVIFLPGSHRAVLQLPCRKKVSGGRAVRHLEVVPTRMRTPIRGEVKSCRSVSGRIRRHVAHHVCEASSDPTNGVNVVRVVGRTCSCAVERNRHRHCSRLVLDADRRRPDDTGRAGCSGCARISASRLKQPRIPRKRWRRAQHECDDRHARDDRDPSHGVLSPSGASLPRLTDSLRLKPPPPQKALLS